MKIAVLSFFHYESSLCLAKHIAMKNCSVDYFIITDFIRDRGEVPGIELNNVRKKIGIIKIIEDEVPKIYKYTTDLDVNYYILRILSFSPKSEFVNAIIFYLSSVFLKFKNYDYYILIGQNPQIIHLHRFLPTNKLIHLIHEIGIHSDKNVNSTSYIDELIKDRSKLILPSQNLLNRLIQINNQEKLKTKVIPFGLFETYRLINENIDISEKITSINCKIFLFYGLIKPYKGLDILLKATEILDENNFNYHLIIAGNGEDNLLLTAKNRNNITIINRYLKNDEIVSLNKHSSCIVCPYKSVSQSGIVMTTFLFEKPIIATNIGEFSNVIRNNYNGILIEPNSVKSLAEAMMKIITDDEYYNSLVNNIKKFGVNDKYSWDNISKETINFLNESDK